MPRMARQNYDTCFFHIIVQGINREYIFQKKEYKEMYLQLLRQNEEKYSIEIISYCIMDNHAHILLKVESILEMSSYMKAINVKYARYYNKKENRVGYVFRDRYKSQPVDREIYLMKCIEYIHNNPVKAKIVMSPEQYFYSSFKECKMRGIETKSISNEICENNFIEIEEDEIKEDIVKSFIRKTGKGLEEIKKDKKLINLLILELKIKGKMSNREIAKLIKKDRETISKIIRQKSPSPMVD